MQFVRQSTRNQPDAFWPPGVPIFYCFWKADRPNSDQIRSGYDFGFRPLLSLWDKLKIFLTSRHLIWTGLEDRTNFEYLRFAADDSAARWLFHDNQRKSRWFPPHFDYESPALKGFPLLKLLKWILFTTKWFPILFCLCFNLAILYHVLSPFDKTGHSKEKWLRL